MAIPTPPPFAGVPTPPSAAPSAPVAAAETVVTKKESVTLTPEMVAFVKANIKTQSYKDMAAHLGITAQDVNNIIQNYKRQLRDAAIEKDDKAYATKHIEARVSKKSGKTFAAKDSYDYDNPLTDMAKKVEAWIEANLSRPEGSALGGGKKKGEGKMAKAMSSEIDSILASL